MCDIPTIQKQFVESLLPAVLRHAEVYFRGLNPEAREEAQAEAAALAWCWALRLAARGRDAGEFPSVLATFAARAVRAGRRLAGGLNSRDVLSKACQVKHGYVVQAFPEADSGVEGNEAIEALRDNTVTPPPDQAAFRIDFRAWLRTQTDRNRLLITDLMSGEGTCDVARRYALSPARVSQMRRELANDWCRFTGQGE